MNLVTYSFFIINNHLCIPCLADIFLSSYLCQQLLKLYTNVYLYKILMPMKYQVPATNIYICKPYLFLHIYDPLIISCFVVMFVFVFFCKCLGSFYFNIHTYVTFGSHICSSHDHLCTPCLAIWP